MGRQRWVRAVLVGCGKNAGGDRFERLTPGWDLMTPLAAAGPHGVCLAMAVDSSRSGSRCSVPLLALASAEVPRPAVGRPGAIGR